MEKSIFDKSKSNSKVDNGTFHWITVPSGISNISILQTRTLQSPLTSIGISNLNGALFYLVCELTYSTIFGILNFLPADFPLVSREYHDGLYSVFSYYVARCLSYLPLFTADGLIMLLVSYWMVGFSSSITQVIFEGKKVKT